MGKTESRSNLITAFEIGGFKAFAEPQQIPLKPITLIFGPNNAGKSSALQGIIYGCCMMRRYGWVGQTFPLDKGYIKQNQEKIYLGSYSNFCNHAAQHIQWSMEYTGEMLKLALESNGYLDEIETIPDQFFSEKCKIKVTLIIGTALSDNLLKNKQLNGVPKIQEILLHLDNELLIHFHRHNNRLIIRHILIDHSIFEPYLIGARTEDVRKELEKIVSYFLSDSFQIDKRDFYPPDEDHVSRIQNMISGVLESSFLSVGVTYLGPLRTIPSPLIKIKKGRFEEDSVYEELSKNPEKLVDVNKWLTKELKSSYVLEIKRGTDGDSSRGDLHQDKLLLKDTRTGSEVTLREIGVGISQFLPVLISACVRSHALIIVEQPELHLHPALQAEIGDVFIESALGERQNTFILETHSEHLILRLLRRIRETTNGELPEGHEPVKPSDVAVIYAEPTEKGTLLKELRITEDGEFADRWPGGFFPERAEELF